MKKLLSLTLFFAILFIFGQELSAQGKMNEVGFRYSRIERYSIIYKIQRDVNEYLRFSIGELDLRLRTFDSIKRFDFDTKIGVGFEYHKAIDDKFSFVYGFEPALTVYFYNKNFAKDDHILLYVQLGYILGFQYKLNDNIFIGADITPAFGIRFSYLNRVLTSNDYDFEANLAYALLNITYRFNKN